MGTDPTDNDPTRPFRWTSHLPSTYPVGLPLTGAYPSITASPPAHSPTYVQDNVETREKHFNLSESKLKMLSNLKASAVVCVSAGPGLLGTAFGIWLDAFVFGSVAAEYHIYVRALIAVLAVIGVGFLIGFLVQSFKHHQEWPGNKRWKWPGVRPGVCKICQWLWSGSNEAKEAKAGHSETRTSPDSPQA